MNVSELSFDVFESGSVSLELVDEFFECVGESPIPVGRIYKGVGGNHFAAYEFGLSEGADKETVFEDENYLVGYEPDCSPHMFKKMSTYKPVDKTRKRFKNLMIYVA